MGSHSILHAVISEISTLFGAWCLQYNFIIKEHEIFDPQQYRNA
jgi:hypothetical protein